MRCKECREIIPDNTKKYCPECGALVNDDKYRNKQCTNRLPHYHEATDDEIYGNPHQKRLHSPSFSANEKKKRRLSLALCIAIAIFILIIIGMTDDTEVTYTEEVTEIIFDDAVIDDMILDL